MNKSIENIINHAQVSEKEIEKYLTKRVKDLGGISLKYTSGTTAGYPDRLVILRGEVFFVELKSKGKKPTALQTQRMKQLIAQGVGCYVCDSKAKVDEVLNCYHLGL